MIHKIAIEKLKRRRAWVSVLFLLLASFFLYELYHSTSSILSAILIGLSGLCAWLALIHALNRLRFHLPYPIKQVIRWLHAMSFEFFVALGANCILRPFAPLFDKADPIGAHDGTPILLIHGYMFNKTVWYYFKRKLAHAGFGPVYTITLGNLLGSIKDHADKIAEMASFIQRETGQSQIILVGHSMGGLTASYYAMQLAPRGKVKALITIGSPLAGTLVAYLGLGKSARDMLPNSEVIATVREQMPLHPEIDFYQIMTWTDELIVPNTSALTGREPTHHYVIDDIGHMALLFSSRVAGRTIDWLTKIENR